MRLSGRLLPPSELSIAADLLSESLKVATSPLSLGAVGKDGLNCTPSREGVSLMCARLPTGALGAHHARDPRGG